MKLRVNNIDSHSTLQEYLDAVHAMSPLPVDDESGHCSDEASDHNSNENSDKKADSEVPW